MPSPILSIIAASATAVGKTFFIGLVGYLSTKYPNHDPLIPLSSLSLLSRLTFNMLLIPLIYTGVAKSVELSELESLYPIILMSFTILLISFLVTMGLGYLPCFRMQNATYFIPLCIASTFPNIVALPIIIFPALCEYGVVQDLVRQDIDREGFDMDEEDDLMDICNKQANSVVFTYFFGFNLVFWSVGHHTLRNCRVSQQDEDAALSREHYEYGTVTSGDGSAPGISSGWSLASGQRYIVSKLVIIKNAVGEILASPGFIAMLLGFFTSCIGPMQRALFDTGGSLRVIGSALESLSNAGTTFATIIVAASLVKKGEEHYLDEAPDGSTGDLGEEREEPISCSDKECVVDISANNLDEDVNRERNNEVLDDTENAETIESLNGGTRGRVILTTPPKYEDIKISIWQVSSRLLVTPGIVLFLLMQLECWGMLGSIPNIAKLVLLINSAVPGALVVVVILKAEGLACEAAAVSNTYLFSYAISVVTLAVWSSIGLFVFRPGSPSMCH